MSQEFESPRQPMSREQAVRHETNVLVREHALGLLNTSYDIFDSLATDILAAPSMNSEDRKRIESIQDKASAFLDLDVAHVGGGPRSLRQQDRGTILPGQHGGIVLNVATDGGYFGRMNLYGGLRMVNPDAEMRDTYNHGNLGHATRTDRIVSQAIQLNFHVIDPDAIKIFDIWIRYQLNNSFSLERVLDENGRLDAVARISQTDPRFADMASSLSRHSRVLTTLIPSALT